MYTQAQTCAETHLHLTMLLFDLFLYFIFLFPPHQTSKGEYRFTSHRQTTILQFSELDNAVFKCSTIDNLWNGLTERGGRGGEEHTDINTQQIPQTTNKICMAEDACL